MERSDNSDHAKADCDRVMAALNVPEDWQGGVRRMGEEAARLRVALASGLGPYDDMAAAFRAAYVCGEGAGQAGAALD